MEKKPIILIGSLTKENRGAIPSITNAFIEGLQNSYYFIPHYADRKYGKTKTSSFNAINLYYFVKHLALWTHKLIVYRPDIAHYPITSYWNLEKSLIFLKVAKILGCKAIGHLHGGSFDRFWDNAPKFRKWLGVRLLKSLDNLIVLSEYWKDYMEKKARLQYISIVSNPIDKMFEKKSKSSIISSRAYNILFVGSLGQRKGVFDILSAAVRLKGVLDFKIRLVGPEDRVNDLKKICSNIRTNRLENYVDIVGPLYDEAKVAVFNDTDIFLFPSYNENFPLVIIEAACAGLAIITTPVGAIPEFFEHDKSVIFVQPGNIKEIKNAIIELLTNEHKRRSLGSAARKVFVSRLSRDKIMKSLDGVYHNVLGQ